MFSLFRKEVEKLVGEYSHLLEEPPKNVSADLALPCFTLDNNPVEKAKDLAKKFAHKMENTLFLGGIESSGPYVNFHIRASEFAPAVIKEVAGSKEKYGSSAKKEETLMVEFFHANTHKAVHIGHIRNISLGSAFSRILEFAGYKVLRVNYQGDIGPHVAKCIWGVMNLGEKPPKTGRGEWLGRMYAAANQKSKVSEAVKTEIAEINRKLYAGDKEIRRLWEETRQWCLDDFSEIYGDFGVEYDRLYFESEVEKRGIELAEELLARGIAKKSDGALIVDLKKYGLGIYVLLTSQGHAVYQTKELGLAELKTKEFGIDRSIHVVAREQELYFKQIFKTFELAGMPLAGKSYHMIYDLVMLPEGKMSSREGNVVLYNDLISRLIEAARNEVSKRHADWDNEKVERTAKSIALGALKFGMLSKENNKVIVFDWKRSLEFEGDTGPYIQYTCARARSILRKSGKKPAPGKDYEKAEAFIIKLVSKFSDIVAEAARDYKPNHVANYAYSLAALFNEYYHETRVIGSGTESERLAVVQCVAQTLENALGLLGIDVLEEM